MGIWKVVNRSHTTPVVSSPCHVGVDEEVEAEQPWQSLAVDNLAVLSSSCGEGVDGEVEVKQRQPTVATAHVVVSSCIRPRRRRRGCSPCPRSARPGERKRQRRIRARSCRQGQVPSARAAVGGEAARNGDSKA